MLGCKNSNLSYVHSLAAVNVYCTFEEFTEHFKDVCVKSKKNIKLAF
jgi:hypothetical protein